MIEVQEALDLIDRFTSRSKSVRRSVDADLNGLILAEDVFSTVNLPEFRQSSMDGYAINGVSDNYQIIGEVPAGSSNTFEIKSGEAVRIFTGARVPDSADRVVMQEHVEIASKGITVTKFPDQGVNIRTVGSQIQQGQKILDRGVKITPAIIGMLISIGCAEVAVIDPPKVVVLVTGDELAKLGSEKKESQVYESNGTVLQAAVQEDHCDFLYGASIKDDYKASVVAIHKAVNDADLVLISGGISVGDYDFIGKALNELGVSKHFHGVRQKPGKPLFFGSINQTAIFALPGNPASTLTCYYVYVRRWLQRYQGIQPMVKKMTLAADIHNRFGRALFVKAKIHEGCAVPIDEFNSATLLSFSKSELLIYMGADVKVLSEGALVETFEI